MAACILDISHVHKRFGGVAVLSDVSLTLSQGEALGLIGPNGAGKTTLLQIISGFLRPDEGHVALHHKRLTGMPPHRVAASGVTRMFQEVRLFPALSAIDNVLVSMRGHPGESLRNVFFHWRRSREHENACRTRAGAILSSVGLATHADDLAENLSYGEQKLLSLACCVASGAEVLLLDEPIASIAPQLADHIMCVIGATVAAGKGAIVVDHNVESMARVCQRFAVLSAGVIIAEGSLVEVRNNPVVLDSYLRGARHDDG
jgi:branched-chain amino acid transport system ATP-binding protein